MNAVRMDPKRVAKGYVIVQVGSRPITMSERGYKFLKRLGDVQNVRGSDAVLARKLAKSDLVILTDNSGPLMSEGGRWTVALTDLGRVVRAATVEDPKLIKKPHARVRDARVRVVFYVDGRIHTEVQHYIPEDVVDYAVAAANVQLEEPDVDAARETAGITRRAVTIPLERNPAGRSSPEDP